MVNSPVKHELREAAKLPEGQFTVRCSCGWEVIFDQERALKSFERHLQAHRKLRDSENMGG